MKKRKYKWLKILVIIASIGVITFVVYNKMPQHSKEAIINRLTRGIIETKQPVTVEKKVVDAVNTNRSRTVRFYMPSKGDVQNDKQKFLAKGIMYSKNGILVTARGYFQEGISYEIAIPGQKEHVVAVPFNVGKNFVFFDIKQNMPFVAELSNSPVSVGDTVVAIGGEEEDQIATGEVRLVERTDHDSFIVTTIPSHQMTIGSPLMNEKREVVGLYFKKSVDNKAVFVSVRGVDKIINK
ncbi:MAG: hypothetical protein CR972_02360 [Candidatus Moraniibacteriota bacterium]|nr:MAG: hypothetical protein CR972_02360 [Candidatus Moranbacteria bacterium]